jgi:GxxExxY protein
MTSTPHEKDVLALCNLIRETSFEIHKFLRSGHREQIYENALVHRLRKQGINLEQQPLIRVCDEDGTLLGSLKADLLIESYLICEIKGVTTLIDEHIAQVLGYLRASRLEHGLLINFGGPRLQVKKLILGQFL